MKKWNPSQTFLKDFAKIVSHLSLNFWSLWTVIFKEYQWLLPMRQIQLTFSNTIYFFQETLFGVIKFLPAEMLNLTYFQ